MRILICGINYSPELTGIGKYTGEMACWLVKRGHDVKAVTAPPYYPMWKTDGGYRSCAYCVERIDGAEVYRCPLWVPRNPSGFKRMAHLLSFSMSAVPAFMNVLSHWRPHVVLNIAPAFSTAPLSLFFAKFTNSKTWLHIQDFELEAAFSLGLMRGSSSKKLIGFFEKNIFQHFDRVSTLSEGMLKKLDEKGVPQFRRTLLPNWVDLDGIFPMGRVNDLRKELRIHQNKVLALYSGSMGKKQGLEVLIDLAKKLRDHERLHFVISGDGSSLSYVRNAVNGFPNITLLPLQPVNRLNELLNMADIHLLPQRENVADLVMPSKLTGMLASGVPVLATAHEGTEIAQVVKDCGLSVPPGDHKALLRGMVDLAGDPAKRQKMGAAGRAFAVKHFCKERILSKFETELKELTAHLTF